MFPWELFLALWKAWGSDPDTSANSLIVTEMSSPQSKRVSPDASSSLQGLQAFSSYGPDDSV